MLKQTKALIKKFLLAELGLGLRLTGSKIIKKKTTIQFPVGVCMLKQTKALTKKFLLAELGLGLRLTGSKIFKKKTTIQFPEESTPRSPLHRGVVVLRKYANGEERCIACRLCEVACPPGAITIEAEARPDGSRRTTRFDIDVFKCINCGLCEAACPVDSIVCHSDGRYVIENRGENIMPKATLLALGEKYESEIARNRAITEDGEDTGEK